MTVLGIMGESDTMSSDSGTFITTAATSVRNDTYSRSAMISSATFSADTSGYRLTLNDTTKTSIWVHEYVNWYATSSADYAQILIVDSSGNDIVRIDVLNGDASLQYHNGTAWIAIGSSLNLANELWTLDIEINLHDTTGRIAWYKDGNEISSLDGDTLHRGSTGIATIVNLAGYVNYSYFSELIVADECTVGWQLATSYPTADGTNTAWTGAYGDVDDILDDATSIHTGSIANKETYTGSSVTTTGMTVKAVVVAARARSTGTGPSNIKMDLRPGTTDYVGSSVALTPGWTSVQEVWDVDPDTSAAWSTSAATSAEFGVESA